VAVVVIDGSCYVMGGSGVAAAAMNDGVKFGVVLCWRGGCCCIGNGGGVGSEMVGVCHVALVLVMVSGSDGGIDYDSSISSLLVVVAVLVVV
jgi:hypothetical protein